MYFTISSFLHTQEENFGQALVWLPLPLCRPDHQRGRWTKKAIRLSGMASC